MKKTVYALIDPRDGAVRYIGCSARLSNRLGEHRYAGKTRKDARARWVGELLALGLSPTLTPLERGVADWEAAERRWIAHYREAGAPLLNESDGGKGSPGHRMSEDNKEALRERLRGRGLPQKPWSDERRAALSQRSKGRKGAPVSPETRERISAALLGRKLSDEHRKKLSEAHKNPSEETRGKLRQATLARPEGQRKAFGQINKGRKFSPEHRANMAEAARRRWALAREQKGNQS